MINRSKIIFLPMLLILIFNIGLAVDYWVLDRDDVVPAYLWTCGCTPTSATMLIAHYDWYMPIGKYTSYGRLVPRTFERYVIENYTDSNGNNYWWSGLPGYDCIPYSIYRLAYAMSTDAQTGSTPVGYGQTNVKSGIENWANTRCGYYFLATETFTTWNFSGIWSTIQGQINQNRPLIWSRNGYWSPGVTGAHSVAVIGFSDLGDVYYRSTWDLGWHADPYQGNGQTWAHTVIVSPGGGNNGNDVELFVPDGDEVWPVGSTHDITWYQFGTTIDNATIWYSIDSGYTWTKIDSNVTSTEGWNYYSWTVPDIPSPDAFILVAGYDVAGTYIAAEGSQDRFTIDVAIGSDETDQITVTEQTSGFSLKQNNPNPVFSQTVIRYSLPEACNVELKLFDVIGNQVAVLVDDSQLPGVYQVNFDVHKTTDKELANGVYFYRLTAGRHSETKKMIIHR